MKSSTITIIEQRDSARTWSINCLRAKKITAALILALLISATGNLSAQMATSASATPALLLAFTGKAQTSNALLSWTMEGQTNCKWFVIERSGRYGRIRLHRRRHRSQQR
ncbi:hypothetical protein ACQ86N_19570 [Puia sp. P3]|uniref:hypothetical protein n=1 Tax=Puia sp. P3 TaxID=3423952 RepID=UPI003D66AD29